MSDGIDTTNWRAYRDNYYFRKTGKVRYRCEQIVRVPDREPKRIAGLGPTKTEAVRDAKDKAAKYMAAAQAGLNLSKEGQTFGDFAEAWMKLEVEPEGKPGTINNYRDLLRLYILPVLGPVEMSKLSAQHIQDMMLGLKDRVSDSTRRMVFGRVRHILNRAVAPPHRLLPYSPMVGLKAPRAKKKAVAVWNVEEVDAFTKSVWTHHYGPLFVFALHMGMRPGEMFALHWEDVDLKRNSVYVHANLVEINGKIVGRFENDPKTAGSIRHLQLTPQARAALQEQLKRRMAAGRQQSPIVFPTTDWGYCLKSVVRRSFERRCKKAGVKVLKVYGMRHTHATLTIAAGGDSKEVQGRLGHASIVQTLDTYAKFFEARDNEVASKLGAMLAPVGAGERND